MFLDARALLVCKTETIVFMLVVYVISAEVPFEFIKLHKQSSDRVPLALFPGLPHTLQVIKNWRWEELGSKTKICVH